MEKETTQDRASVTHRREFSDETWGGGADRHGGVRGRRRPRAGPVWAGRPERLTFGRRAAGRPDAGNAARQDRPPIVAAAQAGHRAETLVAAAALANARTFGGEDYIGFHTMMALAPAFHMAGELPEEQQALPVLKVLYRNANRIQESGGRSRARCCTRSSRQLLAGRAPAAKCCATPCAQGHGRRPSRPSPPLAGGGPDDAFNDLLFAVQDETEVHRVVLPYRAWDLLDLIGKEHAHTLLRQSVRYCVKSEREWNAHAPSRTGRASLLPKLLDQYKLVGKPLGTRTAEDAWVDQHEPDRSSRRRRSRPPRRRPPPWPRAWRPTRSARRSRWPPTSWCCATPAARPGEVQPNKPVGSVHGDSIGVHACDSANAWRNMARVGNPRTPSPA